MHPRAVILPAAWLALATACGGTQHGNGSANNADNGAHAAAATNAALTHAGPADDTPAGRFDAFVREYLVARYRFDPSEATSTGVHEHDGELDDVSREAVNRYAGWLLEQQNRLEQMLPSLPAVRTDAPADGSDRPRVDADLLLDSIRFERLRIVDLNEYATRPGTYHQLAADAVYQLMVRDFAPVDARVRDATARLRAVPAMLHEGERWLEHPSRLSVEVALREISGSIEMVRDIFPTFAARSSNEADRQAARAAATEAANALTAHRDFLQNTLLPRATGDYHAGRDAWVRRARLGEGTLETPETIRDAALAEVRRLQADIRAIAPRIARPGEDPSAVLSRLRHDHPPAAGLLDAYRARQDSVRGYVRDHRIATIDASRDNLSIEETPGFLRATIFAALSSPGALEQVDRRTLFYVTPADTTRPAEEIEAYLTEHSNPGIVVTTIHEAYPGHHVQGIHQRTAHSLVRRILWHSSFGEGWAHYAEQMMVDEGFGDDTIRIDQRQEALLRAARAYLDVMVHVFGLNYEDAVRFYRDEAYLSQPGAEIEARRVCLNPATVYVYTYGKFAIYRMRALAVAHGQSLSDFHNTFLDFGSAPLPVMARALYDADLPAWRPGEVPTAFGAPPAPATSAPTR